MVHMSLYDSEIHLSLIQTLSLKKKAQTILIVSNMVFGIKLSLYFIGESPQVTLFPQLGCCSKKRSVTKSSQSLDIRVLRLQE